MSNILVIDDDHYLCDLISKTLSNMGHDIKMAYDGKQGIELIKKHGFFSMVITDINMPRMDGNSVAGYIKNHAKLKEIPVVAITGLLNDVEKELFSVILEKPFQMKELIELTNSFLKEVSIEERL